MFNIVDNKMRIYTNNVTGSVGAVILPNKVVEEDTVIAAGSLLTKNTEPKDKLCINS